MKLTAAQRFIADHDCIDHPEVRWDGERLGDGYIVHLHCRICGRWLYSTTSDHPPTREGTS